jgi:hypothetical protein
VVKPFTNECLYAAGSCAEATSAWSRKRCSRVGAIAPTVGLRCGRIAPREALQRSKVSVDDPEVGHSPIANLAVPM